MTRSGSFSKFLQAVLAENSAGPMEPAEPACFHGSSWPGTEKKQRVTGGTAHLVGQPSSSSRVMTRLPSGTIQTVDAAAIYNASSSVPRFRPIVTSYPVEQNGISDDVEREAMALIEGQVPNLYASEFAHIQVHCPYGLSHAAWQQAVNDAGLFLDQWGFAAADFGWTPGALFSDPPQDTSPGGLVWRLAGRRVVALLQRGVVVSCGSSSPLDCCVDKDGRHQSIVWISA